MKAETPKTFDPKIWEQKIYQQWESSGGFKPAIDKKKRPYTIIMPPPNAYDKLHIGHALFVTLEDIMVRYHRLRGEPTLWLPGADHAATASQIFYEKKLRQEGKSRHDLGRERFNDELMQFMLEQRNTMEDQLRRLGASCDWTRKKFTLDEDVSQAVVYTFKKMYNEGLIYRGKRVINWSPKSQTGLSDLEVVHKEVEGELTSIRYPIKGGGEIVVATTRPETMLGDTAVAVHPRDKRYKDIIGKVVVLPLMGREIPVIGDEAVDIKFGTGAVKITPAHDPNDFEMGQRHNLEEVEVIDKNIKITKAGGKYAGMKAAEARDKIIEDLDKLGLIAGRKKFVHSVPHSERTGEPVEQLLSEQWFVKIEPLAKPAIEAVKKGKIKMIPKRFEKVYFNWMENIRDWNISRQLWWGHRIPVYYLESDRSKFAVAFDVQEAEKELGGKVVQDEDTLDTWFSSGLWPFTTLGWPEKTEDFKYFYPTTVMETGHEIIFFWVARMIMLGLYCTGEAPFELVYFNGIVRDKENQKISRSKGNIIDPMEMVEKYGADALRMGMMMGTAAGQDTHVDEDKIRAYRNFANKIWNAARFINIKSPDAKDVTDIKLGAEDKKMLDEFSGVAKDITKLMDKYDIGQAGDKLYQYFWHRFCDECIEEAKLRLEDDKTKDSTGAALNYILKNSLKLLHPFVPFVTEAVWQTLYQEEGLLLTQKWPAS
ncbi:valine--tRNA ligase [Patescibacteria group bacterium]|nr:valine--tRNA ligase [Patescibacteria group bacterium]